MKVIALGMVLLALVVAMACGQHSSNPVVASGTSSKPADKFLRFHPEIPEGESARSSVVVPFGMRVPAGTPISVRLLQPLSSASARVGEDFQGVVDENVTLDGQILVERGTRVHGRVVEASARRSSHAPGYLRLALTEVSIEGKERSVRTYTDFFKGAGSARRSVASSFAGEKLVAETAVLSRAPENEDVPEPELVAVPKPTDVQLGVERRLTFHLLEPLSLAVR